MALFKDHKTEPSELDWLQVYDMTHWWKNCFKDWSQSNPSLLYVSVWENPGLKYMGEVQNFQNPEL